MGRRNYKDTHEEGREALASPATMTRGEVAILKTEEKGDVA